jgi:hypothetical protein
VCVATSHVTITAPECARLFLDEGFAIGQLFRQLRRVPAFELMEVTAEIRHGKRELARKYKLVTEGFESEIVEVFPDRDMFIRGEAWLDERNIGVDSRVNEKDIDMNVAVVRQVPPSMWSWLSQKLFPSWVSDRI